MDWWDKSVRMQLSTHTIVEVTRASIAADLLLTCWPGQKNEFFRQALQALLESMENPANPELLEAARQAFVEAAKDGGLLLDA